MDLVIGLGSNLGSRRAHLQAAIALLASAEVRVLGTSRLYESEPLGPPQPRYYNAAVRVQSDLDPHALLARLLAVEAKLGRVRDPAQRWTARTIDLDILWAEARVDGPELTIPHARLCERWFALAPLLDVALELAPEYGPKLDALGGARGFCDDALDQRARGAVLSAGRGFEAAATALDRDDALADALAALGRRLWPSCGTSEAQVVRGSVAGHADPLTAFARSALDHAARGFAFAHVTVAELDGGRFEGRLLGARTTDPAESLPGLIAIVDEPHSRGRRVALQLAP